MPYGGIIPNSVSHLCFVLGSFGLQGALAAPPFLLYLTHTTLLLGSFLSVLAVFLREYPMAWGQKQFHAVTLRNLGVSLVF